MGKLYLKTKCKEENSKKKCIVTFLLQVYSISGAGSGEGRANHHRFRRNRKPQKNHSSVRKPLISHCSSERRQGKTGRRKTRCKKKSVVPTFPRPLLIGQSVRKTLISYFSQNEEKQEKVQIFSLNLCPIIGLHCLQA